MQLSAHPRLYLGPSEIKRARQAPENELVTMAQKQVCREAIKFAREQSFNPTLDGHNWHLIRARLMQTRVVTLALRWQQTREEIYRAAVVRYIRQMGRWRHWSWIAWREGWSDSDAVYDLSYGENSATLALAYDLLFGDLDETERADFVQIARDISAQSFLKHTAPGNLAWWYAHPDCNWNPVCTGGAGMLALAFHEDLPETQADTILQRVEKSFGPYMRLLGKMRGGCSEGVGYWGYGLRYAFMYLLSRENATGRKHRMLELPGVSETLAFPLDFMPRGAPSSFGDINRFYPPSFWYAAATRYGQCNLLVHYDRLVQGAAQLLHDTHWPNQAELVLLRPRATGRVNNPAPHVGCYPVMDWCTLADQRLEPNLHVSIRGGSTLTTHAHLDVGSFNLMADGVTMLENISNQEYVDTTFSSRRNEIFEITPQAKNTLLINGVGIASRAVAKTEVIRRGQWRGVRLDLTSAMGVARNDMPVAKFAGRLFLLLNPQEVLIIDRVAFRRPQNGRIEARFYSSAEVTGRAGRLRLKKGKAGVSLTFAASQPMETHLGGVMLSCPQNRKFTGIQRQTKALVEDVVMACLISRDRSPRQVQVQVTKGKIEIALTRAGEVERVVFNQNLRLR